MQKLENSKQDNADKSIMFRNIDSKSQNLHPALDSSFLKSNDSIINTNFDQKSEGKDNTTMETTPDLSLDILNSINISATISKDPIDVTLPTREIAGVLSNQSLAQSNLIIT